MARNRTLDGFRGLLALDVIIGHTMGPNAFPPFSTAWLAVCLFFALSAHVLVPVWNGRYLEFLARRAARLWPVYASCLAAGYLLSGHAPALLDFAWDRMIDARDPDCVDGARWSLIIEVRAMLIFPLISWCRTWPRAAIGCAGCIMATAYVSPWFEYGPWFILGAATARYHFRLSWLETPIAQWLGRISYPLYLSHELVLDYSGLPAWGAAIVSLGVAEILTRTIEKWSIDLSRLIQTERRLECQPMATPPLGSS